MAALISITPICQNTQKVLAKENVRECLRGQTADPFAIRWKIKTLFSITWDLNGRKYRIRIGRYFSPIEEILFVRYGKDYRSIRRYEANHEWSYLFSRWLSWPLAMTMSIVYEGCSVCVLVLCSRGNCLLARGKNRARSRLFPSIFFLSDRGLPLYPPSFLSRGQTSGT